MIKIWHTFQLVGAFWYLFSIEAEVRCWHKAFKNATIHDEPYLSCERPNQDFASLLKSSCAVVDPDDITDSSFFNFGIFTDALKSGVLKSTTDFTQKFFYCFWWGLRSVRFVNHILCSSLEPLWVYL